MEEHLEVLVQTVRDLLARGDVATAVAVVDGLHPSDLAGVLAALDPKGRAAVLGALDPVVAGQAVWELDHGPRADTLAGLEEGTVAALVASLPDDGAADLLQDLPADRRERLLDSLPAGRAAALRRLLGHEETTAGGLMSPSFVAVAAGTRVGEVFEILRAHRETAFVYYVYVLDAQGRLVGVTSLRELLVTDPALTVDQVMHREVVAVTPATDQEEVAHLASRYDLLAVPVLSPEGRMLGVVTADDVLEVLSSEAEEDIERFVGSVEDQPGRPGLGRMVRARLPWVVGTFAVELVVAYLFLRPLPPGATRTLLAFLPLLVFTGGNAAIAAAGVTLRRLVRGERRPLRLLARELQGGAVLALLGGAGAGGALYLAGEAPALTGVIAGSVGLTVLVSSVVGAATPVVLWGLGGDPALASGPLLGVVADGAALAVYLLAARTLL